MATSAKALKENEEGDPETMGLDMDGNRMGNTIASSSVKGRPSTGSLVMCPTSVLRQWAEELAYKVTSKGYQSVYVYHGSTCTKDPHKYDLVLTLYCIVSMEVSISPWSVKVARMDYNQGCKMIQFSLIDREKTLLCLTEDVIKEKHSSMSNTRHSKKTVDNELVASVVHPIARVGWFKVIFDEAQSIKNHKT